LVAEKLRLQLAKLLEMISPSHIISKEAIINAMEYVKLYDPAYKGILPPQRPFYFPTNLIAKNAIPFNAGTIPPEKAMYPAPPISTPMNSIPFTIGLPPGFTFSIPNTVGKS